MQSKTTWKSFAAAAVVCVGVAGTAQAYESDDARFYVGGQVNFNHLNYKKPGTGEIKLTDQKNNRIGAGAFIGGKFNSLAGAEVGYNRLRRSKYTLTSADGNSTGTARFGASDIYVDLIGYLPVQDNVSILGSVGLNRTNERSKAEGTVPAALRDKANLKKSKTSLRVGLGAEVNFGDEQEFGVRVKADYIPTKAEFVRNQVKTNVSLIYYFL